MSKNHQFVEFEDKVVARWVKTVPHMVSGIRLNPYKPEEPINFVLRTAPRNFDYGKVYKLGAESAEPKYATEAKVKFEYEDEVLELYSEVEVRRFERLNRVLIEEGLLKPYNAPIEYYSSSANLLSDEQIEEIVTVKNLAQFKSKIKDITSAATMARIIYAVTNLDRPASYLNAAQERLNELNKR